MTDINIVEASSLSKNKDLANILALIAGYYVIDKQVYRAKAFATGSEKIGNWSTVITSGTQAKNDIRGVGDSIAAVIDEYIQTGVVARLKNLEQKYKESYEVVEYFKSFHGIGPVTAIKLYNEGHRTLDDLKLKADLTEAQTIGVMWKDQIDIRIPRQEMDIINQVIKNKFEPLNVTWSIVGSYRRGEEDSGDIDIFISSKSVGMSEVLEVLKDLLPATLASGPTKYMGIYKESKESIGHRIDIRIFDPQVYPFALMYFTGSQKFNILMRNKAISMNYTLSEYGLFHIDDNKPLNLEIYTEDDIFKALGVVPLTPEQRVRDLDSLVLSDS